MATRWETATLIKAIAIAVAVMAARPTVGFAGPPYLTDDPQPTDTGHWEIYNFVIGAQSRGGLSGESGLDLNYGAVKDVQLTAVLPLGYDDQNGFSTKGFRGGTGVVELAAKYKIVHADDRSWIPDLSIFPRLLVPTETRFGGGRTNLFLPVWVEKDHGPWQLFGGGGYQINPGTGQRNFWQGGLALNRSVSRGLQLGVEVYAQTRAGPGEPGYRAVDIAATYRLTQHWSFLASAGPSFEPRGEVGEVFYVSLKADY